MARGAIAVKGVSHVSIYVSDMDRSLAFYRDVLGFETIFDDKIEGPELAAVSGVAGAAGRAVGGRIGDLRVELLALNSVPQQPRPPGLGLSVLSIEVESADDAHAKALAIGCECRGAPVTLYGTRLFFVLDPDGQGIELTEYPPGSTAWGGAHR